MQTVRIRPDGDRYIAYFTDSGRVIEMNATGAQSLDGICNQGLSLTEVVEQISSATGEESETVRRDVQEFMQQVEKELNPDTFNLVEQRQYAVPMGVELQLNEACNLRCRHCFQEGYRAAETMPVEQALNIIDCLGQAQVFEISLIGGEPLLYRGLEQVVAHCHHWGLAISLTTNGTLVTDRIAAMLQQYEVSVYVSLDGIGAVHDEIRGEGNFDRTDAAIATLLQHEVSVDALFTLNAINVDNYDEVIDYCRERGVSCNFNLFKPFKPEHAELVVPPERFFQVCLELYERRVGGEEIGFSNAAIAAHLSGLDPRQECTATLAGLVIDPKGRMVTCPGLVSCGHLDEPDLPLFDDNWLVTWHTHPVFTQFRQDGLTGCQVRSCIFCGNPTIPDPYSATKLREYLERR